MDFRNVVRTLEAVHNQTIRIADGNEDRARSLTVFLRGDPGIAKSSAVYHAAKALKEKTGRNIECRVIIASQFDPADLGGFPYRDGKTMNRARPFFLPEDGEGFLFLDEVSQCPTSIQNILAQLVQERHIGEHILAPRWTVVLAGNLQSNRAGTSVLVRQLTNRCNFVKMDVNVDHWLEWAYTAQIDPAVVGYIAWMKAAALHSFDPAREINPTPRTWEKASEVRKLGLDPANERELLNGCIGEEQTAKLNGFIKVAMKAPDPAKVARDPKGTPLPEGPEMTYATCVALTGSANPVTIAPFLQYLDRIDRKEYVVFFLKAAFGRDPSLQKTKAVSNWLVANSELFLGRTN